MLLQNIFSELLARYAPSADASQLWREIETAYSGNKRYYHTLSHLHHLLKELQPFLQTLASPDSVLFALYYHDIVYNVLRHDNEAKSAVLAAKRLTALHVPEDMINACNALIMATASHQVSNNNDIDLFTDADLAVLGSNNDTYMAYANNIRREYSIYPDMVYHAGRKKVLSHFLAMPNIYKTQHFAMLYEQQARLNMTNELKLLK